MSFSLTTFADDGQLKQVNNALAASNNGETAIGVKTKEGVILACEKYLNSILIDETSFQKIVPMSKYIGATYSGLGPDFKVLAKKSRKDYQKYQLEFIDTIMPVHSLAKECASLMQSFTQSGGVRPFGLCTFYAGYDRTGNHLYQVDPSGAYYELKAGAIGKGRQKATQALERRYKDEMSLDDGLAIIIDTLREGYDGELNEKNIEIGIVNQDGFRLLSTEEIKNYLKD
jgi:20S proteasome subunit alpha 2